MTRPDWGYGLLAVGALVAVTFVTRCFFIVSRRELPMPGWLREALRYAPLGAIVAVIASDVIMANGHLLNPLRDARPLAAIIAGIVYLWRRSLLATMVGGTAALLVLKLGFGMA